MISTHQARTLWATTDTETTCNVLTKLATVLSAATELTDSIKELVAEVKK